MNKLHLVSRLCFFVVTKFVLEEGKKWGDLIISRFLCDNEICCTEGL